MMGCKGPAGLCTLDTCLLCSRFSKLISQQPLIRKHSYLNHRYPGNWLSFHDINTGVYTVCVGGWGGSGGGGG